MGFGFQNSHFFLIILKKQSCWGSSFKYWSLYTSSALFSSTIQVKKVFFFYLSFILPFIIHLGFSDAYKVRTNFEKSLDMWSNDHSGQDTFDWIRKHGSTSTLYTGPRRDHTKGTSSGKTDKPSASGTFFSNVFLPDTSSSSHASAA